MTRRRFQVGSVALWFSALLLSVVSQAQVIRDDETDLARPAASVAEDSWEEGGIRFVYIEADSFMMGSPSTEVRSPGETQHLVSLTRDYAISQTEVTIGQWRMVTDGEPVLWSGSDAESLLTCSEPECPIVGVSTVEAYQFCNRLSENAGVEPCYVISSCVTHAVECWQVRFQGLDCRGYRLPTEAEWEFAARGGVGSPDGCWLDESCLDQVAWHGDNSPEQVQPVATKRANSLGLYDMLGNVWEFTMDVPVAYTASPAPSLDPHSTRNGLCPAPGVEMAVIRGGSVSYAREFASPSYRGAGEQRLDTGFRIVRTIRDAGENPPTRR